MQQNTNVTISLTQCVLVSHKRIRIVDVTKVYTEDAALKKELSAVVLYEAKGEKREKLVFTAAKVIQILTKAHPGITVTNLGEPTFILEYVPQGYRLRCPVFLRVAVVVLISFFGSAFTIMTFNQDVDVAKVFERIYQVVGFRKEQAPLLEIGYTVGLPLGILIFFNHFSRIRLSNDPTPLEVQMRTYEKEANETIMANAVREGKSHDVS